MARVAMIGLGRMGSGMAGRLLAAGHDVVLANRTPERAAGLVAAGAVLAPTAGRGRSGRGRSDRDGQRRRGLAGGLGRA